VAGVVGVTMRARDLTGKRGESIAMVRLMTKSGGRVYFQPHPLGEKCPTYDYLVELVGAGSSPPYFFAQVKSTAKKLTKRKKRLPVGMKKTDVLSMVRCPVPTYLIGVDEPSEAAYIISIHGTLDRSIPSMPTTYPLSGANLRRLWDEVKTYWATFDLAKKNSHFAYTE
jgi:hypothetical protein